MPVYQLPDSLIFPDPEEAEPDGLLAVGGDLSVKRLLLAYRMGIFPWYSEGSPILWWSPDPRLVLAPSALKVPKSLKRVLKKEVYSITMDQAFDRVIRKCASAKRRENEGTWIVDDMIAAYSDLHRSGFAHSVEAWQSGELVGGLYGVSLGDVFFGESMFADKSDASKVALVYLAGALKSWGVDLIDCQVTTGHLKGLGAREIPRTDFLKRISVALEQESRSGRWTLPEDLELPI